MAHIELSIIVPSYNEAKNIPLVMERFKEILVKNNITAGTVELIIVDNNSSDNSADVLRSKLKEKENQSIRTVFQPIPGYGVAVWKGLEEAKGEFLCWTHADLQTDLEDTIKAYHLILKQNNPKRCFIKGKRYGRPFLDVFFTAGMSIFETLYLQAWLWDINAQPNLFHRSFLKQISNPPIDFSFDLYFYYLAKKRKYSLLRFLVFFGERIHGVSSWNGNFALKWKFIKRTLKFSKELKRKVIPKALPQ